MKKLALIFAGLALMVSTGCKDDEVEQEYLLAGTWKPVKEVITEVPDVGSGFTDEINYSVCEQESRWVFNEDTSGKRTDNGSVGSPALCTAVSERNFTYIYNKSDKKIEIKYQGTIVSDKGMVNSLDAETLNLKLEDNTDPAVYKTTTYTFKRVL